MAITLDGNNANTVGVINSKTAVASTSGTSIDFTSIPAGVKRITVMFSGVSTNGASQYLIQLGDSGGIETTGYIGASGGVLYTAGFGLNSQNAANVWYGAIQITLLNGNLWVANGTFTNSAVGTVNSLGMSKELSGTLDRIRITTVNGTDTFDAGSINILYE